MNIFTRQEQTEKRYTVGDAISQAKMSLQLISNGDRLCTNVVSSWDIDHEITLEKLSSLVNDMLFDSDYNNPSGWR